MLLPDHLTQVTRAQALSQGGMGRQIDRGHGKLAHIKVG
jgi:hypothetical protein